MFNIYSKPNINKNGVLLPCVTVFLVGLVFVTMICVKYYFDIENLEDKFVANAQANANTVANTLEIRFSHLYEGLHTIANLESIKTIYDNPEKQTDPAHIQNIQQIYNLLYSSIKLSEIYILPRDFDPVKIDPLTGRAQEPTLAFDHNIVGKHNSIENRDEAVEEIEIYEYQEIILQLDYLKRRYPNLVDATIAGYPAVLSKEVLTCDNSYYSPTDFDNSNREGLLYSVPFFNNDGKLAGVVTGVFLTKVLSQLLPDTNYTIRNTGNNFSVTRNPSLTNNLEDSNTVPDQDSNNQISFSKTLVIGDLSGEWKLELNIPREKFLNQDQVKSTRFFTFVILLATILLTVSIFFIVVMQIRQRRLIEGENSTLEKNITQRTNQLKESEARATLILNNAADGVIILNANQEIEIFNAAAERIFQYSSRDITGKHVSVLGSIPEKIFADYIADLQTSNDVLPVFKEIVCTRKDNSNFPLEITISEHLHGDNKIYAGIFRDISARKLADQSITAAREEAEQATKAKSEFLANMSHELRTPLNAILGYCELMQDEVKQTINADSNLENDLGKIHTAGKDLLHHVNSILDLSKIEAGKMELHLERFNTQQMIDDVVYTMQPIINKNNNTIETTFSCDNSIMDADINKTRQIILNLLGNACKFTKNGTITISTKCNKQFGIDWVFISVKDTGIGMNEEQIGKIFNKFTQADSTTTKKFGGTGLGLSISQHFCEMMGGSIKAISNPDSGTEFLVKLPLSVIGPKVDPVAVRFANEPESTKFNRQRISRVLVICSNPLSKDLTERFLTREGFYTDTVADISMAMSRVKINKPDVIVIDENSLSFDSWGSINQLKTQCNISHVPVIMLTKSDSKQLTEAIGATDYLQKPIQRNHLIDVITKHTRNIPVGSDTGGHVLVIDDHDDNRTLLKRMLEKENINVETAENGLAGLEKVNNARPSLIFLDIFMPVMDGFEFVEKLHANKLWQDIPVITITGHDLSNEEKERLRSHVDTMLDKKDLEPAIILEKMRNALIGHLRNSNKSKKAS